MPFNATNDDDSHSGHSDKSYYRSQSRNEVEQNTVG